MPTTSQPSRFRTAATTEESTPPDIATTTRVAAGSFGRSRLLSMGRSCGLERPLGLYSHCGLLLPGRRPAVPAGAWLKPAGRAAPADRIRAQKIWEFNTFGFAAAGPDLAPLALEQTGARGGSISHLGGTPAASRRRRRRLGRRTRAAGRRGLDLRGPGGARGRRARGLAAGACLRRGHQPAGREDRRGRSPDPDLATDPGGVHDPDCR